jgi:CDP-glycerol glycerophosphotransferase (TagB/SpsB family)
VARLPYSKAFGIDPARVLPLGMPRADFFTDDAAMGAARRQVLDAYPSLADRTVVLYAPTFRGRGRGRWAAGTLDAVALRAALPAHHVLVLKAHPNLDPALTPIAGYDVVVDHAVDLDALFTVTDVLVTDYSSSIFEYALLRRPLVLLVPDLEAYERDPGLYLDYRTELIGTQVHDTAGVASAITEHRFDLAPYDAFIERHLGPEVGGASARFVDVFLGPRGVADREGVTLRADVRHE